MLSIRSRVTAWAVYGLSAVVLALCYSSSASAQTMKTSSRASSAAAKARTGTLTVGMLQDSQSLDPALTLPPVYDFFGYDTLIHRESDGGYVADLATSWRFVGKGNKRFQLTLRKGAKFDDGTRLTPRSVVASLDAFLKTPGPALSYAGPVGHVKAVGKDTVEIDYKSPVPFAFAVKSLTQDYNFGMIIGPKGLANPKSLETSTDGVGEYKLVASATTPGTQYTYAPNPAYFNQSAIKFAKVVLKPIVNPASRLSAAESGQIDWAHSMPPTDTPAAKKAGLNVSSGEDGLPALLLEGRTSGPLANQKVRQAIEYAMPRAQLLKALYGGGGFATSSMGIKGQQGYNPSDPNPYPYNPTKAKQLLTAAGYPNGFTIAALDSGAIDPNGALAQAAASALSAVGITMQITTNDGTLAQLLAAIMSKQYPIIVFPQRPIDIFSQVTQQMEPGSIGDAWGLVDPTLNALVTKAASAPTLAGQNAGFEKVTARVDQLAWVVPIAVTDVTQYTSKTISNVPSTYETIDPDPVSPITASNWEPASK